MGNTQATDFIFMAPNTEYIVSKMRSVHTR